MICDKEMKDPMSCLNRAHPHEMIFVLLARDQAAPAAIRAWCAERIRLGKNAPDDDQIREAYQCADIMEAQREKMEGADAHQFEGYDPRLFNLAFSRCWKLPVPNDPFGPGPWNRYWAAMEEYEKDPSRGRPVPPHRSG